VCTDWWLCVVWRVVWVLCGRGVFGNGGARLMKGWEGTEHTPPLSPPPHPRLHAHTPTGTHTHTNTRSLAHTYTHTHLHTHTHTQNTTAHTYLPGQALVPRRRHKFAWRRPLTMRRSRSKSSRSRLIASSSPPLGLPPLPPEATAAATTAVIILTATACPRQRPRHSAPAGPRVTTGCVFVVGWGGWGERALLS
jgi:hypothetical protein